MDNCSHPKADAGGKLVDSADRTQRVGITYGGNNENVYENTARCSGFCFNACSCAIKGMGCSDAEQSWRHHCLPHCHRIMQAGQCGLRINCIRANVMGLLDHLRQSCSRFLERGRYENKCVLISRSGNESAVYEKIRPSHPAEFRLTQLFLNPAID